MRGFNLSSPTLSQPQKYATSRFLNLRMKYRSSFEVIASILEATRESGAGQYAIIRRSGITHSQFKKYLNSLIGIGFVEAATDKGQAAYKTSEKGLEFLSQYRVLLEMLSGDLSDEGFATVVEPRQAQTTSGSTVPWLR